MADVNSWRRHTLLARPTPSTHLCNGQIDDAAPSDDTSCSTSPGADEGKLRLRPRRSLASFASYLGTHHRTVSRSSRSEWLDWSNLSSLNNKDRVYEPNTELMCTTITQQVLANPSNDLPAQYNTFLLHLIEAYHQSKADVQVLQVKLAKESQFNQSIAHDFHGAISSWPLEKTHMLRSPENERSDIVHPVKEVISSRLRKHHSTFKTPKPSIDYERGDQTQRQAEKTRTTKRQHLTSSSRKYSATTIGAGSSHDQWPPLSFRYGMDLIDCDASSAGSEGEGHRVLMSASDAYSGLEDDIASRLSVWLAFRLQCQPGDIVSEMSALLRSSQQEFQKDLAQSTIGSLRPNMPTPKTSGTSASLAEIQTLQGQSKELIGAKGASFQSSRALGHRRGFSFLPGDDSAKPILSNAFGGQDNDLETNSVRPPAWQGTKQKRIDESGDSAQDKLSGGIAVGSRSQQPLRKPIVSSTAGLGVSRGPQREGSGNSVRTTTISSSSRSPSLSHTGSLNSNAENDRLWEGSGRPGNGHLAVAAARAARNGATNRQNLHGQSSS